LSERRETGGRPPEIRLCEPKDPHTPSSDAQSCVEFRTPSLRNVAVPIVAFLQTLTDQAYGSP